MTSHAARFEHSVNRQSGILRVRATRTAAVVPVVITLQGACFQGTTLDLGVGGAFIETLLEPDFEAHVNVTLRLPAVDGELQLPAVVRWRKPGGIGVHFLELGAVETYAVTSLVEAITRSQTALPQEAEQTQPEGA
jgi:hypothetical protein